MVEEPLFFNTCPHRAVVTCINNWWGYNTSTGTRTPASWATLTWPTTSPSPRTRARPGSSLTSWRRCCSPAGRRQRKSPRTDPPSDQTAYLLTIHRVVQKISPRQFSICLHRPDYYFCTWLCVLFGSLTDKDETTWLFILCLSVFWWIQKYFHNTWVFCNWIFVFSVINLPYA